MAIFISGTHIYSSFMYFKIRFYDAYWKGMRYQSHMQLYVFLYGCW